MHKYQYRDTRSMKRQDYMIPPWEHNYTLARNPKAKEINVLLDKE
jgi:hypothetical protein